ncbi:phenylalanine--tRNA ligase subunit beta [Thermocrispum municipale]|uniref:phenylalanine--tRNA ligase subunit beta n=1 Tax=Thermocrispum municipale TaxID=37926 RepID=UPI0003FDC7E9|nr:phenylalanine--tRNA ligase subunit beta [Thermocrispum municipale]
MKVPYSWLTEHLALEEGLGVDELVDALIRVGIEVEDVHRLEPVHGPLVIGRVEQIIELTEFKKPIRYCRVDVGDTVAPDEDATRGIICGATNFSEGDLVVVALPGAVLPGNFAISARKTYGHLSEGMICSARELGIGDDHTGILVLPRNSATPGEDAREGLGLDDAVLDLTPTPDRGYALSIRGMARELACALDLPFADPGLREVPETEGDAWPVRIEDPAGCKRFVVRRVSGLDPKAPTPWWMQRRLMLSGIRSISLAVDVTNYVMLELGQPLHAFDADSVKGELVVRRAKEGEKLTTLDDVERTLDPEDIVICDETGVISLAGTMGGATTEITAESTDVLLEGAFWDPASISRTSRRHHLFSEAAKRFERHTDPAVAPVAVELAATLLRDYGGGTIEPGRTDEGGVEPLPPVTMPISLPDQVAGVSYERGVTARRLTQIGCKVSIDTAPDGTGLVVAEPPTWRPDLKQPADLVEEVLRLEGYDTIPSTLPAAPAGSGLTAEQRRKRSVARALAEAGYVEVVPAPFVSAEVWDKMGLPSDDVRRQTVSVLNALDAESSELTTTLLPGLLDALLRNESRGLRDIALFHIGQVFLPQKGAPQVPDPTVAERPSDEEIATLEAAVPKQPVHVAVVLSGHRERAGWWGPGRQASWADAIETARVVADISGVELTVEAADHAPWHPGRCARLLVGDWPVGYAGELHPKVVEAMGLPKRTAAMELDLDAIPVVEKRPAPAMSPYPPVLMDVALVVDAAVPAASVAKALRSGGGDRLEDVSLFDVYTGEQIGEGKQSLAFKLRFRDPERTLSSEEAVELRDAAVAAAAEQVGASLRA